MKKWLFTLIISITLTALCAFAGQYFLPEYLPDIYNSVPDWMKYFIIIEILFTALVISYSYNALYPQLHKAEKVFAPAQPDKEKCYSTIQKIIYDKRKVIADYFDINIQNGVNISGKQASEFINEDEILQSFTHISVLKAWPAIITSAGLCCTFIAILLGLGSVQVADDGNIQGITGLINNLSGKFSTSIVALILAIIVEIFSSSLFAKIHKAFLKIEQTIDFCYRVTSFTEKGVMTELTKNIAAEFLKTFNNFQATISGEEFQHQMGENRNIISEVKEILTNIKSYAENIGNTAKKISAANTSLTQFTASMDKLSNISNILTNISEELKEDNKILSDNYHHITQQLPEMVQKFAEVCNNMRGHLAENYHGSLETAMQEVLNSHIELLKNNFSPEQVKTNTDFSRQPDTATPPSAPVNYTASLPPQIPAGNIAPNSQSQTVAAQDNTANVFTAQYTQEQNIMQDNTLNTKDAKQQEQKEGGLLKTFFGKLIGK